MYNPSFCWTKLTEKEGYLLENIADLWNNALANIEKKISK
ncbi:hypothetical protein B14911_01875, partial [Bacillus sp. NRRL B-14911]